MKRSLIAICFLALSAAVLPADTTAKTPAQAAADAVARYTRLLTLTTAQQALALPIFTAEQTTLATVETAETTAETALQAAILKNDLPAINTQATALGNLETQEIGARAKAEAAFYVLLTPAQQTIFAEIKAGSFGGRGGHR